MSERESLHTIIYDELMLTDVHNFIIVSDDITNKLIAAGYRKPDWTPKIDDSWHDPDTGRLLKAVPDDCVVVGAEDIEFVRMHMRTGPPELRARGEGVLERLKSALTATRPGED